MCLCVCMHAYGYACACMCLCASLCVIYRNKGKQGSAGLAEGESQRSGAFAPREKNEIQRQNHCPGGL